MKLKDGSTARGNVVSIQSSDWASATSTSLNQLANPEKILIAEGIVTVSNLHGAVGSKVRSIVLPSTLKILENSVWNFPYLESLTLPEDWRSSLTASGWTIWTTPQAQSAATATGLTSRCPPASRPFRPCPPT